MNPEISVTERGEYLEYRCVEGVTGAEIGLSNGTRIYPGNRFVWDSDSKKRLPLSRVFEIFEELLLYLQDRSGPVTVVLYEGDTELTPEMQKFCDTRPDLVAGVEFITVQEVLQREYDDDLKYLLQYNRPLRLGDKRIETEEDLKAHYEAKGLQF